MVAGSIEDPRPGQLVVQHLQEIAALRLQLAQHPVEFFRLVHLHIGAGDALHLGLAAVSAAARSRHGVHGGIHGLHHTQMGVAAEIIAGVVGGRADDRDGLFLAAQRQDAVVLQQDDALLRGAEGYLVVMAVVDRYFQLRALERIGIFKQTHAELGLEHPQNGLVQNALFCLSLFKELLHGGKGCGHRQFHIEACL